MFVNIVTTGLFKEPYDVPVTFLQNVTERQYCKRRTDGTTFLRATLLLCGGSKCIAGCRKVSGREDEGYGIH